MSVADTDQFSILTNLAGVSYRQEAVSRCYEGQTVLLIRAASNAHDPNAIEVHTDEQIGFIPREEAEMLALYMDYSEQDSLEAVIERLTGGTDQKPTAGVIVDIRVSETLYEMVEGDPEIIRELLDRNKKITEIEASLTDDDVAKYIGDMDDDTLDARYWFQQQNKWENEQKEKLKRRLERELESYEEEEIEEKAEEKFLKYRTKYEVTAADRKRVRNSMTRQDVVYSIMANQEIEEMEANFSADIERQRTEEQNKSVLGLVIAIVIVTVVLAIAFG